MPKTKISDYSSTASNNTDVDGINIAEGMAPSNVNNAMREIMAHLKDWQAGNVAQDMKVDGAFTCTGATVLSSTLSVGSNATVSGGMTCTGAAVLSSSLAVTGNATIGGTLSAGSTSLGAATFSGAVIMSSTLAANGNVTVGTSTTNSHTLNGNLTVGTSTSNTVTLNTLLSAGGGTGTNGQYLKSRGTTNTPVWDTVPTPVKAWVNFDGSTAANVNGTYSQSGTTVTVTITGHGLIAGNVIYSDITSGTGVDGTYTVATVTDANTFTYTAGTSLTTSGNITLLRRLIRASSNVGSVTWINANGRFYINFSASLADANYVASIGGSASVPAFGAANIGNLATVPTTGSFGITYETGGGTGTNPQYGYVTVIGS